HRFLRERPAAHSPCHGCPLTGLMPHSSIQSVPPRLLSSHGCGDVFSSFSYLLSPHCIVETSRREQFVVPATLRNSSPLEDVNTICVQDCRESVSNQYGDRVAAGRDIANRLAYFFLGQRVQ